MNQVIGHWN